MSQVTKLFKARGNSTQNNQLVRRNDTTQVSREVMKDSQRELHQFKNPDTIHSMQDHIQNHIHGSRFLFAAITASQEEDESSILRKLLTHRTKLGRKELNVGELPHLRLYNEVETFSLSQVLKGTKLKSYIHLTDILVVYAPLTSADAVYTRIKISVIDDRLIKNKVVKSFAANSNLGSRAMLSLSYCFPREDVDAISLTISREGSFLEEGRQWGVVQMMIKIAELDFPIQTSNAALQGVLTVPQSVMSSSKTNPNAADIYMDPDNVGGMRELYQSGDISNETYVPDNTSAPKYTKSEFAKPKGQKIEGRTGGWEFMNGYRVAGMPNDEQSQTSFKTDSDDEDSIIELEQVEPEQTVGVSLSQITEQMRTQRLDRGGQLNRTSTSSSSYQPKSIYQPGPSKVSRQQSVTSIKPSERRVKIAQPEDSHLRFP